MTLEYFDRWAPWPSSHIHAGVAGMQWSHSILQDPSYKSPWNASEEAMQLAFDLHPASFLRNVNVEIGDSLHHTDAAGKTFVFVLTLLCKSILDWNLALSGLHAVLSLMKFHYEDFCRSALLPLNLFAMNSLNAVIFCIGRVHALYSIGLT